MKNKRLAIILTVAAALLSVPLLAMQLTNEVNWTISDFILMGVLLFGTGLLCELAIRSVKTVQSRVLLCAVILIMFFLVWAELAVGIFGTPFAGS